MKSGECNSDTGRIKVFSQFTGECVIEYMSSPNDAIGAYHALEKAVRKAEHIAFKHAKRVVGEKIVNNLLDYD